MRKPTVLQLARRYLSVKPEPEGGHSDLEVGVAPTFEAALAKRGSCLVIYYEPGTDYHDPVLHELVHALAGPSSLHDESALMVLQWKLMDQLRPSDYRKCRDVFAIYSMGPERDIGHQDDFLYTQEWESMAVSAIASGLLTPCGEVPEDLSIHPEWRNWSSDD